MVVIITITITVNTAGTVAAAARAVVGVPAAAGRAVGARPVVRPADPPVVIILQAVRRVDRTLRQ
jgi:hypothetical protein